MNLRQQLAASVEMARRENDHDNECRALAHLARSEMRWSIGFSREGRFAEAAVYRSRAWWHLGKARQKRDLADALRMRAVS